MWGDNFPPLEVELARSSHPRLLTPAFLDICSPRIDRCWRYWDAKRQGRRMPSRADIDPTEIADLLPYIVLTEVLAVPPYLIYRLVGTKQVAVRGRDPTGLPVREHYIGHHEGETGDEVILNYRLVIERATPIYDYNPTTGPDDEDTSFSTGPVRERGTLLLPLSNDDVSVNMVFCCADIVTAQYPKRL
ncbi:PAS domain-containing protein [Lacibacterium aquatile]|uniref:PAS domain-containing protein n=1 Tax=Lacibacterium aquatile TaxID=1168082 RepID=A0ABW5DLX7_9PROT